MAVDLAELYLRWGDGQALAVGKEIFERVPTHHQPRWAAEVLRVALLTSAKWASRVKSGAAEADEPSPPPAPLGGLLRRWRPLPNVFRGAPWKRPTEPDWIPAVRDVLAVTDNPHRWSEGRKAFDRARGQVMQLQRARERGEETPEHITLGCILALAELTASLAYNATHPPDPFDEDCGPSVASCLRAFVERSPDPTFEAKAWEALVEPITRPMSSDAPGDGTDAVLRTFTYRLIRASWGLFLRVHYQWTPGPSFGLSWAASTFDDGPARLERGFLRAGTLLGRLEICRIDTVPTDYQPDVFLLAGIGMAAEITGTEPNYPDVNYDDRTNTYIVGP